MSKYLALEWDEHEIRLAVASQRGSGAVLERAFAVPLPESADGTPHDAAAVAKVLREALSGESLRKLETLAVVGRPNIELKEMSLPPAPPEDLPDMVRFQALRDFTQMSDDTPLDFIPLPGHDAEHQSVLAAAISNDLLAEIQATCEKAGLELQHLVLRPCAASSLLSRHQPAEGQVRMFVDLLGDEVDLTVLDHDTPLLMRTTRLPGDASQPEYCRPVFLEIRRTIAAVQNKLHGRRVEKIWLCGDGPSQQTLAEMAKAELDLPTELFDPFTAFDKAAGMGDKLPPHHSRFAPLLGLLATAAAGERHAIDFLDPRKRPVAQTRKREAILAAAVAAVVLLMFVGWTWWKLRGMDNEIAQLTSRFSQLDSQNKKNATVLKNAEELERWMAGDVPWLDVLNRLSANGPKAEDAMLTSIKADVEKTGGGKLTLDVLAVESGKVIKSLNQVYPKTKTSKIDTDDKHKRYKKKFTATATIDPQAIEAAKKAVADKTAAMKAAENTSAGKKADEKADGGKGAKTSAEESKAEPKVEAASAADAKASDTKTPASAAPEPKASEAKTPSATADAAAAKTENAKVIAEPATPGQAQPVAAPAYGNPADAPAPSVAPSSGAPTTTETKKEG